MSSEQIETTECPTCGQAAVVKTFTYEGAPVAHCILDDRTQFAYLVPCGSSK